MRNFLRFLTDRKWIPVCLTEGQGMKWIFHLLTLMFVVFFVLLLIGLAMSEDLFFSKWKVENAVPSNGYIQFILFNPDPNGGIKKVVVAYTDEVVAYWFFDEWNNPQFFELKEGEYVSNPAKTKNCINCHAKKTAT